MICLVSFFSSVCFGAGLFCFVLLCVVGCFDSLFGSFCLDPFGDLKDVQPHRNLVDS